MELQKPTGDEYSRIIGMAEAGINIKSVALHFHIHKITAYRIINRFGQTWLTEDCPRSGRQKENLASRNVSLRRNRGGIDFFKQIRFAQRLGTVDVSGTQSIRRNRPELSLTHVEDCENVDSLAFFKHLFDRHCAPYKRNLATMHARFGIE